MFIIKVYDISKIGVNVPEHPALLSDESAGEDSAETFPVAQPRRKCAVSIHFLQHLRSKAMTKLTKKTIITIVLVALAFILTVTALVIAVINRGAGNRPGDETDKAGEAVTVADVETTGENEQTADKPAPDYRYEDGEVIIDIGQLQ